MDVKQTKVSSFLIDNTQEDKALAYIEKNAPLLKGYLLLFSQPLSSSLKEECERWRLCYVHNHCKLKGTLSKEQSEKGLEERLLAAKEPDSSSSEKREIFRTIRSGETITHYGDLVLVGNVNDGATITSAGSLSIFGIIEGDISCNGSYLILSACRRGKVIFQGCVINEMIKDSQLKLFYKENEEIKVKGLH